MTVIAWIAYAASAVCTVCRFVTGSYIYSALISAFAGGAVLCSGGGKDRLMLAAGLFASVVADWFLCHQSGHSERFLYGVIGFFVAHCLFAAYAGMRFSFNVPALAVTAALLVGFGAYMYLRALPHVPQGLKIPIVAYVLISIASLYAAFSMKGPVFEKILYIAGVCSIVFSDTMIAENIFVGVKQAGRLVHPTYYACHLLIALSALIR